MTNELNTESGRSLPQAPTFFDRHTTGDRDAILAVFATLERGVNASNGDLFDSVLGEDVIWGSPKGQIVIGLDELNPIHRRLAANSGQYGNSSQFTLEALGFLGPDVACASVRRTGLDENGIPLNPSSGSIVQELALYVLVRRDDRWWMEPAITNSVAVKFDLYSNAGEGSSSTGVYLNGAAPTIPSVNLLPSGIDLHSGDAFHVVLVSDGATLTLTITDKATNASFARAFMVDIPAVLGGPTGYVGFTASTGEKTSVEKILNWQFTSVECCTDGEPNFPTGFSDASGLTINGNGGAAVVGGTLELTDGTTFTATSVFDSTAIPQPNQPLPTPFTSDFDFQLGSEAGDGFTFVLQSQGLNALGGVGGGLGFGPDNPDGDGPYIGSSVAVKFDLHNNAGEGSNSTGVYIYGLSPTTPATDLTPSGINLHSGHTFHARLTYDGANVKVSITDLTEYAVFTQSYAARTGYPPPVYAGFTAGTGHAANIEKILNWTMTSY